MANKRTNEEITIVEKFGEKLSCYSKELKISQTGLATAIGVSEKTIARYVHGENAKLPSNETIRSISNYLKEKAVYKTYTHRSAKRFGGLLSNIMNRMGLTQQQAAKITGKSQGEISKIISCGFDPIPTFFLNTKEQYDILNSLHNEASQKYGTAPEDGMESIPWEYILGYYDGRQDCEVGYPDPDDLNSFGFNWSFYLSFTEYDTDKQELILNYPHAFFEQSKDMKRAGSIENKTFGKRYKRMKKYLAMSQKERKEFIRDLEGVEGPRMVPAPDEAEQNYYLAVAEMVMLSCGTIDSSSDKKNTKLKDENCRKFRKLMTEIGLEIDSEQEMEMKKSFSSEDWYVWCQMLIDEHNKEQMETKDNEREICPHTEYFEYR